MDESIEIPVPGQPIDDTPYKPHAGSILTRVRELCGWGRPTFPGSQPVSLATTNIKQLANHPYVACEKSDGVRYLLFAASKMVFLIDRKETIQVLKMTLPTNSADGEVECHQSTLLDGELVRDKLADGSTRIAFLIYDAIAINRDSTIGKRNLLERLRHVLVDVIRPRCRLEEEHRELIEQEKLCHSYLPIFLKDFYEIWDILAIRNAAKRLPHLSDGIIFTPVALPYVPGTCRQLMKWKPPELNTIDFGSELLYAVNVDGQVVPVAAKLMIGSKGFRRDSGCWIVINSGQWATMWKRHMEFGDCDGAIWECFFDPKAVTLVPAIVEDGKAREDQWKSFWRREADALEAPEAEGEEVGTKRGGDVGKARSRKMRKVLALKQMDSVNLIEEDMVKHGYLETACPIAKSENGSVYYDFNQAVSLEGGWVLERIRTDKNTANDERVMVKVKESIDSGISFVALFDEILSYRLTGAYPCYEHCTLPEYYAQHGTRLQHTDTTAHQAQQQQLLDALNAPQAPTPMAVDEEEEESSSSSSSSRKLVSDSDSE